MITALFLSYISDERFIHKLVSSGMTGDLHHSREKSLLLYFSRRKPCKYIFLIQLVILAVLIAFFVPIMLLLQKSKKHIATIQARQKIYQTYIGSITLMHCNYMYPQMSEELCDRQCGNSAYIVLRYENSIASKAESSCPSQIQTIPCHEKPVQCKHKLQLRQCPGVNGISLFGNLSITPLTIFKVPLLNITKMKKQTVSALELFAVCPRCRIFSFSYKKSNGICYRQLETVREGWPEQYRICDSEVISEDKACDSYDAS